MAFKDPRNLANSIINDDTTPPTSPTSRSVKDKKPQSIIGLEVDVPYHKGVRGKIYDELGDTYGVEFVTPRGITRKDRFYKNEYNLPNQPLKENYLFPDSPSLHSMLAKRREQEHTTEDLAEEYRQGAISLDEFLNSIKEIGDKTQGEVEALYQQLKNEK